MKTKLGALAVAVAAAALAAAPAPAQEKPGTVALVYSVKPKPGAWAQLDAAVAKHYAWHRAQKDTFAWLVWQVATGEDIGSYVGGTFGHHWKEWDARTAFDQADDADFVANVLPLAEAVDLGYWAYMPDASNPSASPTPAAMSQITHYYLMPEGYPAFVDALKQMKAAMSEKGYPMTFAWYRLVSGGEGPQLVLAVDRASFSEMAPPDKPLDARLAEAVGAQKAASLLDTIRKGTRSTRSYLLRYRPDLSYVPAK